MIFFVIFPWVYEDFLSCEPLGTHSFIVGAQCSQYGGCAACACIHYSHAVNLALCTQVSTLFAYLVLLVVVHA